MNAEDVKKLREPFPPEHVGQLPKGRTMLDYVGHGAVTDRLLEVDPEWNWEPLAFDANGLPLFSDDGTGLWIKLTVLGVTRLGYGSVDAKAFDAEKQLIGDAIRNAAMRFGVALDLWIKGQEGERPARNVEAPPSTIKDTAEPLQLPEGWENQAKCDDAHTGLREVIAALDPQGQAAMREFRKERGYPWPMSAAALAEMWGAYYDALEGKELTKPAQESLV
jgi:hypothetical protein